MYMDSRQNISSLMGPPGYPHMPPMSNTTPTMTGDSSIALLTGQEEQVEQGVYVYAGIYQCKRVGVSQYQCKH